MLNLGCGTKMDGNWNNLDFSPYARFAYHIGIAKFLRKIGFISEERFQNLLDVDPEIILWDLRKGIPFDDDTFDVVYHSHFLEHIDKDGAPAFLRECYRALKTGGILRVVVPDLQKIIIRYNSAVNSIEDGDPEAIQDHEIVTYELFDQMVSSGISGTKEQRFLIRFIERIIRGNTAKVGERHRWMYDKYSLCELFTNIGFKDIKTETPTSSSIEGWTQFNLDINEDGSVYKLESLYIEGVK